MRIETALEHSWAGLDVAKASFDAAFVTTGEHHDVTRLREIPVKRFARTPQGAEAFVAWLDECGVEETARVCMEATGSYSTELAVWLLERRPSLRPAIVNPR